MIFRWLLASILLVLCAGPASAQDNGLLLGEPEAKRLVEDLRDLKALRAIVETVKAQSAAKDRQIGELQTQVAALAEAAQKREAALAVADDRDKRRVESEERLLRALDVQDKALERAIKTMDRADKRIETLESRQFWMQMLGPLGLLVGYALAAF